MIIKITVHDTDSWRIMEEFIEQLPKQLHEPLEKRWDEEFYDLSDYRKETREHIELLSIIFDGRCGGYNIRQKGQATNIIRKAFTDFVKGNSSEKFLLDSIEVRVLDAFVEEDGNTEDYYWIPNRHTLIRQ